MPNRLQWWRDRPRDPRFLVLATLTLITLATAFALHLHITAKAVSSGAASGLPLVY